MPDHEPVPDMHTSLEIGWSKDKLFIGGITDCFIPAAIGSRPVSGLIGARNGQKQADIRMACTEGKHLFRGQRIKAQSTAADKPAAALLIAPENDSLQTPADFRNLIPVDLPVAGETYGILFRTRCSAF